MTTTTQSCTGQSVPIAIWPSAQRVAQTQRGDRYVPESREHPAKMLPDLARRIVEEYSHPGDLVVDPMAGIGTTVVEAAAIGRRAVGVEIEDRWVDLARQNLKRGLSAPARRRAKIRKGDARDLVASLGGDFGQVDLIVTSPPYGCEIGMIDKRGWLAGGSLKPTSSRNYATDKNNLGHARGDVYEAEMLAIYRQCFAALRPGGLLVTVTKNMHGNAQRSDERLVDLAGLTVRLARQAGFTYLQHVVSLLCAVRDDQLVGRPSLWQFRSVTAARHGGSPIHLTAHEDVLLLKAGVAND